MLIIVNKNKHVRLLRSNITTIIFYKNVITYFHATFSFNYFLLFTIIRKRNNERDNEKRNNVNDKSNKNKRKSKNKNKRKSKNKSKRKNKNKNERKNKRKNRNISEKTR